MAAAKSILRSSPLRSAAAKIASKSKSASSSSSSSFLLPKSLAAPRILRSPIETRFCVKSLLPMRSATTSALMTSRSFSSSLPKPEVDSSRRPRPKKIGKSRFSMLSPLHFHYEDVLRQDLLLKLNCDNIMQVPGLCEVRLAPKESTASTLTIKFGKLAMEILGGQRFFKAKRGPNLQARKSSRPEAFMGSDKDTGFTRQSTLRGEEMTNFLVRTLSVMSMLDSPFEVRENSIKFSMGTEFCQSSPELEDHFEFFEQIRAFNVTITTSALTKEETSLLWSGLLNDEGESK